MTARLSFIRDRVSNLVDGLGNFRSSRRSDRRAPVATNSNTASKWHFLQPDISLNGSAIVKTFPETVLPEELRASRNKKLEEPEGAIIVVKL